MGRDLNCIGLMDGVYGFWSTFSKPKIELNRATLTLPLRKYLPRHPKKGSFRTTVTQTLTTIRGMKITPLLRYPTTTTWHNSHRLPLHNSGAQPPVYELFRRPSYVRTYIHTYVRTYTYTHKHEIAFRVGFWKTACKLRVLFSQDGRLTQCLCNKKLAARYSCHWAEEACTCMFRVQCKWKWRRNIGTGPWNQGVRSRCLRLDLMSLVKYVIQFSY
jgi:hypothetical protein